MNRRLFMKSVGAMTLASVALLSSCVPKPTAKVADSRNIYWIKPYPPDMHLKLMKRDVCPCSDCQAGRPTKELHWVNLPPKAVILNDEKILTLCL